MGTIKCPVVFGMVHAILTCEAHNMHLQEWGKRQKEKSLRNRKKSIKRRRKRIFF